MIIHPVSPLYDTNSKILILGSFPSVKSREQEFFYAHPQNRLWKVISLVFNDILPITVEEKKAFLHKHHIAMWDVIYSCEITGSADSSIKNAVPTDLTPILETADIQKIFVNGRTSEKYYKKYTEPLINRKSIYLPSTSPANAAWSVERLVKEWSVIAN